MSANKAKISWRTNIHLISLFLGMLSDSTHGIETSLTGPVFVKEPRSVVEFMNTRGAYIDCSAHGDPFPEIKWIIQHGYEQETTVKDIPSILKIHNNGTLELKAFDTDQFTQNVHTAVYRCTSQNLHGRIISTPVSVRAVTKQQLQQIQAQVYDEYVVAGNSAVLKCHIPAYYKDDLQVVAWIREDNLKITHKNPDSARRMTENGNLLITDVTDSGTVDLGYWCQVKNKMFGETFLSQTAGKIIRTDSQGGVGPVITEILDQISIEKFQDINLTCAAQGSPPPSFKWKFQKTAQIEVFIEPNIKVVDSGSKIKLECNVNGYPIEKVKWILNGKTVKSGLNIKAISTGRTLEIVSAVRKHEGMYQCFVSNSWQEVQSTAQIVLGDLQPTIVQTFKSRTIQPGPSISLKCVATGRPTPKIIWKHNGRVLSNNEKLILRTKEFKNGTIESKIVIKNIRSNEGGEYSCIANNILNSTTYTNYVNIYGLPVVHELQNVTVAAGQDAVVRCFVSGHPIKNIVWERVGRFSNLPKNAKTTKNGTLILKKARPRHSGKYTCSASNGRGQIDTKLSVIQILDRPSISGYNYQLVNLKEKEPFSEICSINRGDEPITISWRRNGRIIILGHGIDIATTKMYSVLQIREVKESDAGNYTCLAENKAGNDTKTVELRVSVAPKWIMKPIDVHEVIGGSATINCKAGGYPEPTIKWAKMKGRKVLTLLRNNNQQSVYPNGSLHFINIQKLDSGKYSCIASNGIREDLVHEINLKIKDVPVITYINGSISVSKNQAISLQCNAVGTGTISIKWIFKNNVLVDNDDRITITRKEHENEIESILNINNAKENLGGIYHCRASNENGHDEKQLTLRIKGRVTKNAYESTTSPRKSTKSTSLTTTYVTTMASVEKSQKDSIVLRNPKDQIKEDLLDQEAHDSTFENEYEMPESSIFFNKDINFKTIVFIVPGVAVIILLVAIVITIIVYIVIRNKNQREMNQGSFENGETKSMNGTMYRKRSTPTSTLDRRYGRLERPFPMPINDSKSNLQDEYEIPDYYAGMKPYSTMHFQQRHALDMNSIHRSSQATL